MNTEEASNQVGNRARPCTPQKREELLKEYKDSGLSRNEFCAQRNIKITTFYGWFKKRKKKRTVPAFAQVKLTAPKKAPIEISLPNGKKLGVHLNGKQDELASLIRGVLGC